VEEKQEKVSWAQCLGNTKVGSRVELEDIGVSRGGGRREKRSGLVILSIQSSTVVPGNSRLSGRSTEAWEKGAWSRWGGEVRLHCLKRRCLLKSLEKENGSKTRCVGRGVGGGRWGGRNEERETKRHCRGER